MSKRLPCQFSCERERAALCAPSVLRSKTLKSTEFISGDLSQIRGPRETWFRGGNWRDNPNAIQNFGYTQE